MSLSSANIVGLKLAMGADSYNSFMSGNCFSEEELNALIEGNSGNLELTAATLLESLADPQLVGSFKLGDLAGDLTATYTAWLARANMLRDRNGANDRYTAATITAWSVDVIGHAELANSEV